MRLSHRRPRQRPPRRLLSVSVLLCALLGLVVPAASPPAAAAAVTTEGSSAGATVARLYEEAARASAHYEEGRRAARLQKRKVRKLDRLLAAQRRRVALLSEDLGLLASAQYRTGGGLPHAARLLLADSPDALMRGRQVLSQADLAVNSTVAETRRAATRLVAAKRRADLAKRALIRRNARLARLRRGIERKLESARWTLQGQADRAVAAGRCRGAVRQRLRQPKSAATRAWVTPVREYELSAGFDSTGRRWAHRHTGQDFAVGIGAPVRSVGAGRVHRVACGGAFGIEVVVRHRGGYFTQYAHLATVTVDKGDKVRAGQWVGQAGTTGNSTGPHLHFETRLTPRFGSGIDPRKWLARRGVRI